jgi:hypothetical protein
MNSADFTIKNFRFTGRYDGKLRPTGPSIIANSAVAVATVKINTVAIDHNRVSDE